MNEENYPRLLLITANAFNHLSGGGIFFTNLFHGWPKDKIATVHNDKTPPATDVCEKYYKLGRHEFKWAFPFSLANLVGFGQERVEKKLRETQVSKKGAGFLTSILKKVQKAAQFVFGDEIQVNAHVSDELRTFIKDFKPEVIYTILGNLEYMRLVRQIADEFKIPFVIHMMDDWPEVIYTRGIFGPYRRFCMKVELQRLVSDAAACLGICDAMSEVYEKRYGRKWGAFHNALDASSWLAKARKDWSRKSPFKILYAGALMPDSQVWSVKDVGDAVSDLHARGLDIEFDIYAPWYFANLYRSELERPGCVKVLNMPETMDIESLFTGADLLLLPVNFDKKSVDYIRYSMPNKIPAYMFSGTPTLAYGPSQVASISYAKSWAHCVTKKDKKELCDAIQKLAADEKLRERLALHAQKLAIQNHDRAKVGTAFQKVLMKAASVQGHIFP